MSNLKELKKEINNISVARWYDPVFNTLLVIGTYFFFKNSQLSSVELALTIIFFTTIYMFVVEIIRAPWLGKKLPEQKWGQIFKNTFTKYLGIIFGLACVLFLVWLFPEYEKLRYINTLGEAKPLFLFAFLPISLILVFLTEIILGPKRDGTFQFGLLMTLKLEEINWKIFRDGCLEWLLRMIFLIINFTTTVNMLTALRAQTGDILTNNFISNVLILQPIIFLTLLFTILPGYVFSSRLIGTHTRKVDATWFAWVITLVCYQPFSNVVFTDIVNYTPDVETVTALPIWVAKTMIFPVLLYIVGAIILFCDLVHLWGEAIMGIRASNLTNRGIITNGPFRYTKHPIYLIKCVGWFLIALPFLNGATVLQSIQFGILFIIVCLIFGLRCLAEERLLATDENYVKYALFIDKHGLLAGLGKIFPIMSFEWRLNYWKKHGQLQKENYEQIL